MQFISATPMGKEKKKKERKERGEKERKEESVGGGEGGWISPVMRIVIQFPSL